MRIFGLRIHIILLTFLIVLGGFLGAEYVRYESRLRPPLEQVLLSIPGVEAVEVEPGTGLRALAPIHVTVYLHKDADLERTWAQVQKTVGDMLGRRRGAVMLEDARDQELDDAWREMRFAVEEALATGSFRQMVQDIHQVAAARGLDRPRVSMDGKFIYVTVSRGDAYLHRVISREPGAGQGMGEGV